MKVVDLELKINYHGDINGKGAAKMWRSKLPTLVSKLEFENRRNITQQEIAEETGVRRATVNAWMNWSVFKRLDSDTVTAFIRYFKCTPDDLFEYVPEEEREELGQLVAVA